MAMIETDDLFTTDRAVKKIGKITVDTLRRYCLNFEEGRTPAIKAVRWGRTWLIHKDEIERFKNERQKPGRPRNE